MKKYVCKRVLISAFTLFVIVLIMFLLMELMPGTPFNDEKLEPQQIEVLSRKYGLDQPVLTRFWKYLTNTLRGDFGVSYVLAKNMSITDLLANRFPVSIRIALLSMLIGTVTGIIHWDLCISLLIRQGFFLFCIMQRILCARSFCPVWLCQQRQCPILPGLPEHR